MLVEWLQDALASRRADDARVGLVLLDIDHFKVVNDSLGHEAGDELLATAASRLEPRAARRRPPRPARR